MGHKEDPYEPVELNDADSTMIARKGVPYLFVLFNPFDEDVQLQDTKMTIERNKKLWQYFDKARSFQEYNNDVCNHSTHLCS